MITLDQAQVGNQVIAKDVEGIISHVETRKGITVVSVAFSNGLEIEKIKQFSLKDLNLAKPKAFFFLLGQRVIFDNTICSLISTNKELATIRMPDNSTKNIAINSLKPLPGGQL